MTSNPKGIWTALATPFHHDNSVDLDAFRSLLKRQIAAKVDGVIPCGTTGESPTLSSEEKKELIQITLKELKGTNIKVFAGTGTNDTRESIEFSSWASHQGVNGVLIVTPYYNKPSQKGLTHHFLKIADSVNCEVMLYNVPGRTGINIEIDTAVMLSKHKNITSIKEASGNIAFTGELISRLTQLDKKISILSGDDPTFLASLSIGAQGIVSVASNVIPDQMISLYRAFSQGNWAEAQKLNQKHFALFKNLFIESNPAPVKQCLEWMGLCSSALRPPLAELNDSNKKILKESLKSSGLLS